MKKTLISEEFLIAKFERLKKKNKVFLYSCNFFSFHPNIYFLHLQKFRDVEIASTDGSILNRDDTIP